MDQQGRIKRVSQQSSTLLVCCLFCQQSIALPVADYRSYSLTAPLSISAKGGDVVIIAQSKNDRRLCRKNKQKYQPWCKSCCNKPRYHRPMRKPRASP